MDMKIRLGYACISKTLEISSSSIITFTEYSKNPDIERVKKIIKKNLENLEKLLDYNLANDIYFFRLSSKIIPLATKKEVEFDYIEDYKENYEKISKKAKNMRLDFHPDQYTVLNSVKKEVVESAIENLEYHYKLLQALNIKEKVLVLHIGSSVFGKNPSITRFINVFNNLPKYLQECIVLENDDKVYTAKDTLELCEKLKIPMVLDYHHHLCNSEGENISDLLPRIFDTWKNKNLIPKMHFSSPKSKLKKEYRSHHDFIDVHEFIKFLYILKFFDQDIDIMIEAKAKDEAVFRLLRTLKYLKIIVKDNEIII